MEWKDGCSAYKKTNEAIIVVTYAGGHAGYRIRESALDQVTEKHIKVYLSSRL